MRRLVLGVLLLGVAAWVLPAAPAHAFEGTLKWRLVRVDKAAIGRVAGDASDPKKVFAVPLETLLSMHGEAEVTDATISVKGSKVRADTTARDGQAYYITDLGTGVTQVVMPAEKRVMEIGREDVQAMQKRAAASKRMFGLDENAKKGKAAAGEDDDASAKIAVVALDKTETINGLPATAYRVEGADVAIVGWVTSEHADVLDLLRRLENSRAKIGAQAVERKPKEALTTKGLPVRVQTLDARQYLLEDLIQVEDKPMADDLFVVPADFEKSSARQSMQRAGQLKKP